MALFRKQNKDQNGKKPMEKGEEGSKKGPVKKITPKVEKKPAVVKKDTVNRLEKVRKYFRGVYNELKKVHWPNRKEVLTYTSVVVVAVIIVGVLIWLFDSLMSRVIQLIIR